MEKIVFLLSFLTPFFLPGEGNIPLNNLSARHPNFSIEGTDFQAHPLNGEWLTFIFNDWVDTEDRLVFPGVTLPEIGQVKGFVNGTAISVKGAEAIPCHDRMTGNTVRTIQYQHFEGLPYTKCVKIQLTEKPDGVYAKALYAKYFTGSENSVGLDFDRTDIEYRVQGIATSPSHYGGYGIERLIATHAGSRPEGPIPPAPTPILAAVLNRRPNICFTVPGFEVTYGLGKRTPDNPVFPKTVSISPDISPASSTGCYVGEAFREDTMICQLSTATTSGTTFSPEFALTNYFALSGSPFGMAGADLAFDGDMRTVFTADTILDSWLGLDFGGNCQVAGVRLLPGNEGVRGGYFELSETPDFSAAIHLLTLPEGRTLTFRGGVVPLRWKTPKSGRYVRFVPADGGPCQIAELEFIAPSEEVQSDLTVTTTDFSTGYRTAELKWTIPPECEKGPLVYRSVSPGGPWHFVEELPVGTAKWIDRGATGGISFFYQVVFRRTYGDQRLVSRESVSHIAWQWLERDPEHPQTVKAGVNAVDYPNAWKQFPLESLFDNNTGNYMQNDPKNYSDTKKFGIMFDQLYRVKLVRIYMGDRGRDTLGGGRMTGFKDDNWKKEPPTFISEPFPKSVPVGWNEIPITDPGPWKCAIFRKGNTHTFACEMQVWGYPIPPAPETALTPATMERVPKGKRANVITWREVPLAEGYRVERRDLLGGWECVHQTGKDGERSYTDQPPSSFSGWTRYRVATFRGGEELYSKEVPALIHPFFGALLILE